MSVHALVFFRLALSLNLRNISLRPFPLPAMSYGKVSSWQQKSWRDTPYEPGWQNDQWQIDSWSHSTSWKDWQGNANLQGGAQFPDHFQPNRECLDATVQWGGPLYRHVQSTPWSRKRGLAGKAMVDVNCADLSYKGWDEPALRWISSGRFASPVWCRSISESVLITGMLAAMRDQKFRLDEMAQTLWQGHDSPPDKIEQAIAFMKPLILKAVEALQEVSSTCETPNYPTETTSSGLISPDIPSVLSPITPKSAKRSTVSEPSDSRVSTSSKRPRSGVLPIKSTSKPVAVDIPDDYDPSLAFHPPGQQEILATCMPRSLTDFAFLHWVSNFKAAHVPADQHQTFDSYTKLVEDLFTSEAVSLDTLRDAAKLWGLPEDLCSKAQKTALLRLVAAASFVAI